MHVTLHTFGVILLMYATLNCFGVTLLILITLHAFGVNVHYTVAELLSCGTFIKLFRSHSLDTHYTKLFRSHSLDAHYITRLRGQCTLHCCGVTFLWNVH